MAPVLWGLDLAEIKWSKFSGKNMWSPDYHLRRTKFVIYQAAMILTIASESVGTAALSDYVDGQDFIAKLNNNAVEYNDDFVGIGAYNIFVGVYIAFVFGGAYFFDLIWPTRHEDLGIKWAWKICALAASLFILGDVIAMTYIVSSRRAYLTGVGAEEAERLLEAYGGYSLVYKDNGRALACLILLWLGFPCTVASTVILWMSYAHNAEYGPHAAHVRRQMKDAESEKHVNGFTDVQPRHQYNDAPQVPAPAMSGSMDGEPGANEAAVAAQRARSQKSIRQYV